MVGKCNYSVNRFEITGGQYCECLRTIHHNGPHVILNNLGKYVMWETDHCGEEEECEGCESEDSTDWCLAFACISKVQARQLIKNPALERIKSA
jgi:hypothetical protein